MKYFLIALVAIGSLVATKEANAHSNRGVAIGGAAIALGLAIAGSHRHRHHHYSSYCDLYPYACGGPRYYYAPRRHYGHHGHHRGHRGHHGRRHH